MRIAAVKFFATAGLAATLVGITAAEAHATHRSASADAAVTAPQTAGQTSVNPSNDPWD